MRAARFFAVVAAAVGLIAIASGAYGLYSLEFLEWAMKHGGAFDNPKYGNVSAEDWRAGVRSAMAVFISFGIAALVAAYGLLRRKRWGEYLWLILVGIHMINAVQGLPHDVGSWIWLTVSTTIFISSLLLFRKFREAHAAP